MNPLKLYSILALAMFCAPLEALTILVDPGHGGHDRGAVRGNIEEAKVVLELSRLLAQELKNKNFNVAISRKEHSFVPLSHRALHAIENDADIFVSIHANSSPDTRAKGAEIYFQSQLEIEDESRFLAHKEIEDEGPSNRRKLPNPILDSFHLSGVPKVIADDLMRSQRFFLSGELAKHLAKDWKGNRRSPTQMVRQGPFYLINSLPIPSVLVEVGYVSHPQEGPMLTQKAFQQQIAVGLANGIGSFAREFGSLLKSSGSVKTP